MLTSAILALNKLLGTPAGEGPGHGRGVVRFGNTIGNRFGATAKRERKDQTGSRMSKGGIMIIDEHAGLVVEAGRW